MAQHASVFTWRNDLRQNPVKHYFVVNVRYSQSTILTLRSQAGIIGVWTSRELSDFQNRTCKPSRLFVNSMVSLLIVRQSALPCIPSGVRSIERGTPPKPQTRNGTLIPPPEGDGSSRADLINRPWHPQGMPGSLLLFLNQFVFFLTIPQHILHRFAIYLTV